MFPGEKNERKRDWKVTLSAKKKILLTEKMSETI